MEMLVQQQQQPEDILASSPVYATPHLIFYLPTTRRWKAGKQV